MSNRLLLIHAAKDGSALFAETFPTLPEYFQFSLEFVLVETCIIYNIYYVTSISPSSSVGRAQGS
jgi:hypothetical protein